MGYETYYVLNAYGTSRNNNGKLVLCEIPKIEREDLNNCINELGFYGNCEDWWSSGDTWRWYDHDEDMIKVSKQFPDIMFELRGDGEESEDFWKTYYLNGKLQFAPAAITYPDFDESLLKAPSETG